MTRRKRPRLNPAESYLAFVADVLRDGKRFRRLLSLIILITVLIAGIIVLIHHLSGGTPGQDLGMIFMLWEQRRAPR